MSNSKIHIETSGWHYLHWKGLYYLKDLYSKIFLHKSQECSQCGEYVKKARATRTHSCKTCGYVADRDENAARNILRLRLESLGLTLEAPTITLFFV